jgi:hypothetical protein
VTANLSEVASAAIGQLDGLLGQIEPKVTKPEGGTSGEWFAASSREQREMRTRASAAIERYAPTDSAYALQAYEVNESSKMDGWIVARLAGILRAIRADIASGALTVTTTATSAPRLAELVAMLRRFRRFARHLERRSRGKTGITIQDEYDVQDLVRAILSLHTDDVRKEEATGSSMGAGARIDFLLKRERIAVEVKRTRATLDAGQLGDELSADILRYPESGSADVLICFIYDAADIIDSPEGFEDDLAAQSTDRLRVVGVVV